MANILWTAYSSLATILGSELNALAVDAASNASATLNNVSGNIFGDMEFVAGGTFSPAAGGFVEVWFLRSLDGTTFEDGSPTAPPARNCDVIIPVRSGTSITPRAGASGFVMPPAYYKAVARNRTGVTLPASGNIIRLVTYCETTAS